MLRVVLLFDASNQTGIYYSPQEYREEDISRPETIWQDENTIYSNGSVVIYLK